MNSRTQRKRRQKGSAMSAMRPRATIKHKYGTAYEYPDTDCMRCDHRNAVATSVAEKNERESEKYVVSTIVCCGLSWYKMCWPWTAGPRSGCRRFREVRRILDGGRDKTHRSGSGVSNAGVRARVRGIARQGCHGLSCGNVWPRYELAHVTEVRENRDLYHEGCAQAKSRACDTRLGRLGEPRDCERTRLPLTETESIYREDDRMLSLSSLSAICSSRFFAIM
jgi:hypothetical protein